MEIGEIKRAIEEWSKARTSADDVLAYLKQGTCFKIEKSNYDLWKTKSPKELHVYLGVFNGQLQFVLIDNESDKNPEANVDSIVVQDYYPGLNVLDGGIVDHAKDGSVKVVEALKRVMRWTVFMESWVRNSVESSAGVFQAFVLPFSDLTSQFEAAGCYETMAILGLKGKNADLMLWGMPTSVESSGLRTAVASTTEEEGTPVEDLATPCPPFYNDGLGLIKKG